MCLVQLEPAAEKLRLIGWNEILVLKPNRSNLFAAAGFNGRPLMAPQDDAKFKK